MPRRLVALGALLAPTLSLLSVLPAPLPSADAEVPDAGADAAIELVSQTPIATVGQPFTITVRLEGIPEDGSVELAVHQRVRSRSELALSMDGQELRTIMFGPLVIPVSALPAQPDGTRRVVLPVGQAGGLPAPAEGVYPVELTAADAAGAPLAELVTHLIAPPAEGNPAPDLAVAMVADLSAPLALQPDGSTTLERADVEASASRSSGT